MGLRKLTAAREQKLRRDMELLVERRLRELDCDSLYQHSQKYGHDHPLFDEPLCPLVNPGCGDDLCYLPADHVGTKEQYHITGTTSYSSAIQWDLAEMAPVGTSRVELIRLGWKLQRELRLDEIDGMG